MRKQASRKEKDGPAAAVSETPATDQTSAKKITAAVKPVNLSIGKKASLCLQTSYLFASWLLVLQPGIAKRLPGMWTIRMLMKVHWASFVTAVASCGSYVAGFVKHPAQTSLSFLKEDQLASLQAELGLSPRLMSALLILANLVVIALYAASALTVVWYLLPAVHDVFRTCAKAAKKLLRAFALLLRNPATRVTAHGIFYAQCLYLVAAGIVVAPLAPKAGAVLLAMGHFMAAGLVRANSKARSGAGPSLFLGLAVASSAISHQHILFGFIAVAALHFAAAHVLRAHGTDYASAKTTAAVSAALLSVSMACRAFGVPVEWYGPFNLAVATISRHSLLVTALMYTNESHHSPWFAGRGSSKLMNNTVFLLECAILGCMSHLLSMTDLLKSVVIYLNIWAAVRLASDVPKQTKNMGMLFASVLMCHGCYFMLTNPSWFKAFVAL